MNAHWSEGLTATGEYDVMDHAPGAARLPDVLIHHDFESHFSAFVPPTGTRAVAVRTWDFGPLPRAWALKINAEFHQFWAHTRWIAEQARVAGVEADRIRVVPHGVAPDLFRPEGNVYPLSAGKRFLFLFVGGVCLRKGTDILEGVCRSLLVVGRRRARDQGPPRTCSTARRDCDRLAALMRDTGAPAVITSTASSTPTISPLCIGPATSPYFRTAPRILSSLLECMAAGTPAHRAALRACLDFCSMTELSDAGLIRCRCISVCGSRSVSPKMSMGSTSPVVSTLAEALRAAYTA